MRNLKFIWILVMLFVVKSNYAQFTISKDTLHAEGFATTAANLITDIAAHVKIYSNTFLDDTIAWKRTTNTLKPGGVWTSAVCDIIQCWSVTTDSSEFVLNANDSGDMSFHLYPKNEAGSGKMIVRFYRKADPSQYQDIVIFLKAWNPSSVINVASKDFQVYPNPTKNNFAIQTNAIKSGELKVLNLLGQTVISQTYVSGSVVNTSALSKGIYLIKYTDGAAVINSRIIIE